LAAWRVVRTGLTSLKARARVGRAMHVDRLHPQRMDDRLFGGV